MHSKSIVSDGVVAAVLVINALANTHLGDPVLGLHSGKGNFAYKILFVPKKFIQKNNQE
jgi:hypothetical protein